MRSRRWILWAMGLSACGPGVAHEAGDSTSTTSTSDDSADDDTPATTQPGTATQPDTTDPTTVADTGATSTEAGAESLEGLDTFGDGGVAIECDIWAQDCPREEKCVPYSYDGSADWSGTHCVPIAHDAADPGDPCTVADDPFSGIDDCAAGSICWGVDATTLTGICYAQCTGSDLDPQCAGLDCWDGDDVFAVCVSTCAPAAPECAEHEGCALDASVPAAFCIPTASLFGTAYGETCDVDALACGSGLACVGPSHVPGCIDECCTQLCDVTSMTECPDASAGQTCIPLFDRAPSGFENLGVCGIAS